MHTSDLPMPWATKIIVEGSGCWIWIASCGRRGYGLLAEKQPDGSYRNRAAHRVVWEHLHGPVPTGHQLHHHCQIRSCVNPAHLRLVTREAHEQIVHHGLQSIRAQLRPRWTTCSAGHPRTPENTYWRSGDGYPVCRICRNIYNRAFKQRQRDRRRTEPCPKATTT